jgi:biotin-dependent carboxylase-like uncharacterized protein
VITVIEPGWLTSIQDGGRNGYAHLGVPQAGAVDGLSLRHANLLAGNSDYTGALEITLRGPVLRFETDAVIAMAGGCIEAILDDSPLPMYQSVQVRAGQVLTCKRVSTGMRCYLAVAGGFFEKPVLGSVSTDTFAGLGPPRLRTGDVLSIQNRILHEGWYLRAPPEFPDSATLRVIAGPHEDWFAPPAWKDFLQDEFEVLVQSDRTGLRLSGRRIPRTDACEMHSQGMVSGAIQVPGDGHPIILLPNHGTTGGYPVIAVVIRADVPRLGQLRPGAKLRFQPVTRDQALAALHACEADLHAALVPADPGLLSARGLMQLAKSNPVLREVSLQMGQRKVRLRH